MMILHETGCMYISRVSDQPLATIRVLKSQLVRWRLKQGEEPEYLAATDLLFSFNLESHTRSNWKSESRNSSCSIAVKPGY